MCYPLRRDLAVFLCKGIAVLALLCATASASQAKDICLVRMEGDWEVTYFCHGDYICNIPQWKCDPSAEELARREERDKKNKWSGKGDDCESAGEFERQTSAWYYACVLNTQIDRKSSYTPKIDPADMSRRAKDGCRGQADFDRCVAIAKQKMILDADPSIRTACSGKLNFVRCVDNLYVYGPQSPLPAPKAQLRQRLSGRLRNPTEGRKNTAAIPEGPPGDRSHVDTGPKSRDCPGGSKAGTGCCGPGYGIKPDPGAFGAWNCQPLGVIFLRTNRPLPPGYGTEPDPGQDTTPDRRDDPADDTADETRDAAVPAEASEGAQSRMPNFQQPGAPPAANASGGSRLPDSQQPGTSPAKMSPEQRAATTAAAIEDFEARLDEVVLDAVESAVRSAGQNLSDAESEQCMAEAFDAVRAVVKGGVPEVSKTCRPLAGAARQELFHYAYSRIDSGDASVEELLAGLAERAQPAIKERQGDCFSGKLPPDELRKCLLGSVER